MTDTKERAELLALANELADKLDQIPFGSPNTLLRRVESALRRLASQDQKPVGYGYSAEIQSAPGDLLHVCREKKAMYDTPLYLSPPPASGWDEAIEAAMAIAKDMRDKYSSPTGDQYTQGLWDQSQRIIGKIKALRHNTAPTLDHGGADAGVRVKPLEWEDADEGMCTKWRAAALGGNYQLVNFGKDDPGFAVNFHWGRPLSFWFIQGEPDEWGGRTGPKIFPTLDEAKAAAQADYERRILSALSHQPAPVAANASAEAKNYLYWAVGRWNAEVLSRPLQNFHRRSLDATWRQVIRHFGGDDRELCGPTHDEFLDGAHPHASDCDKQGCMGDNSPGDAKDLQELLNSPSVLDETTKSEGGVEGHARSTKADSARGEAGSAPSQDGSLAQLAAGIKPGPSDRTADVTVELKPFEWSKITAYEACNGTLWRTAEEATVESRRARDAFTVGRR